MVSAMSGDIDRPKTGIGIFVRRGGKILLGKRISDTHGDGEWSLPGGHLEQWESFEDCCRREVYEETGLKIRNIKRLYFTNDLFPDEGLHYVTLYFTADSPEGPPENREPHKCGGWEWFSLDDLPSPLFCGIREVIETCDIFR